MVVIEVQTSAEPQGARARASKLLSESGAMQAASFLLASHMTARAGVVASAVASDTHISGFGGGFGIG